MSTSRFKFLHADNWVVSKGYTNGVAAEGRQVFVAGQVGWNAYAEFESDDFVAQVEQALSNVMQILVKAGGKPSHFDLAGHLIAESTDAGSTVREYIWLDDMPLAVVADIDTMSPNLYFVHAEHLNRPLKMTNGTEAVVSDAVCIPQALFGR